MDRQLGMFAKYWQPGHVKTRLAADVGPQSASVIYRQFVNALLVRLQSEATQRCLCYSPANRRAEFKQLVSDWVLHPQCEGDLGARMQAYFEQAFATNCQRVLLIGTDSPNLPLQYLHEAWRLLDDHPLVLGPTPDGGYYLIGARDHVPPVFTEIDWSTSRVWRQTVDAASRNGLTVGKLPEWYDVDTLADLMRLLDNLQQATEPALIQLRKVIQQQLTP